MGGLVAHERLRQLRVDAGEELDALAHRTGVRQELLRAIESGCFDRLPPGIYARAAVRTYALAFGLDPTEILDACAGALPDVEEPISGLARLHGVRPRPRGASVALPVPEPGASLPFTWRPLAAAAVDACIVATLLAALVVCARIATAVPLAALESPAAAAFGVMGILFGVGYFVWIGGLMGATAGERMAGLAPHAAGASRVTLRVIAARAWHSATVDARCFTAAGVWAGRLASAGDICARRRTHNGPEAAVYSRAGGHSGCL